MHQTATKFRLAVPIFHTTMLSFRLHRQRARTRVERLIREGVGVRESVWTLPDLGDGKAMDTLAEAILAWVREGLAQMRRPYGIDQVALALACRGSDGRVMCSNSLGVVRPTAFYQQAGREGVWAFFGDLREASAPAGAELVGALLSLGDIAYRMDQDGELASAA